MVNILELGHDEYWLRPLPNAKVTNLQNRYKIGADLSFVGPQFSWYFLISAKQEEEASPAAAASEKPAVG